MTASGAKGLDPKYIFFISLAVALAVVGLWYGLRFSAMQTQLTELEAKKDEVERTADEYVSAASQLPKLQQEVAALNDEKLLFTAALPQQNQVARALADIRNTAQATGVDVRGIGVSNQQDDPLPGGVKPISFDLTMAGTYPQLFQAIRDLETTSRFSQIGSIDMRAPDVAFTPNPTLDSETRVIIYTFDPTQAADPAAAEENGTATTEGESAQ